MSDVFPARGEVEFKDVVMAYRPHLPPTLKGVNFTVSNRICFFQYVYKRDVLCCLQVPAGRSLGICGRTAAGKSSLLVALFRIVRLEDDGDEVKDIVLQIVCACLQTCIM